MKRLTDVRAEPGVRESLRVARAFRQGSLEPLASLRDSYGDVVRLGFPVRAVVVFTPELIGRVLTSRDFRKTDNYRELARFMGEGLVTSEGARWAAQRRRLGPAFRQEALSAHFGSIHDAAETLAQDWQTQVGTALDVAPEFAQLTAKINTKILFGLEDAETAAQLHEWIAAASTAVLHRIYSPVAFPHWVPTRLHRREAAARRSLDKALHRLFLRHRPSSTPSVLSLLLSGLDARQDFTQLRDELVTLMLAGQDTISAALLWFFYHLSGAPEAQSAVAAEVQALPELSFDALDRLVQLRAAFLESMRLQPAVPFVARTPKVDVSLGRHSLKAGDIVLCPICTVQRDPRYWDAPKEFRPRRFLDDIDKPAFMPFALGARKCIGDRLALTEALVVGATLLRRFHFRVAPGFKPEPHSTITTTSSNGLRLLLTRRGARSEVTADDSRVE